MILDFARLRRFTPISLRDAAAAGLTGSDGARMVTREDYLPAAEVAVPAISYGATRLDELALRQTPKDTASASLLVNGPVDRFTIHHAVVHGRHGFVTSGDHLFTDFLDHAPLHLMPGCGPAPDGGWVFPDGTPQLTLADATHLMAANLDNYFHWLVDSLSRFDPALCIRPAPDAPSTLLAPQPHETWQEQSLALLPLRTIPLTRIDHGMVVAVKRLVCVPSLSGGGFRPHPGMLRPFRAWRARLDPDAAPTPGRRGRKLYISRRDSTHRPLVNEADIVAVAAGAGYEVVTLNGMAVADQVRLFSAASRIIAPHGAGLTNLLFCRPGAAVLELHMDAYVQWAFRRLAGLCGLRYGCVIGATTDPWREDWPHHNRWSLDADAFRAALAAF